MGALTLVKPSAELKEQYLEAMEELKPADRHNAVLFLFLTHDDVVNDFDSYLGRLEKLASPDERMLVPSVTYWASADGRYVGQISLRLHLNGNLSTLGGHIGYTVRPSARNRGFATEMLRLCLNEARRLGLMRVLVTCDETNAASRRVIEKNGGDETVPISGGAGAPLKLRFYISTADHSSDVKAALAETLSYLGSLEARQDLLRDPYWPKWTTPWWHMLALHETGLSHRIPRPLLPAMAERMASHYLRHFPLIESEIPEGADPYRHILCHCAMGTMARLLREEDIRMPDGSRWLCEWVERYQMEDGGFNCDEGAYTRPRRISSIESTLPMMEMLLSLFRLDGLPVFENIARGFEYMLAHRLARSSRDGRLVNENWLSPVFPRFYKYDILRGLSFIAECSASLGLGADMECLGEFIDMAESWFEDGSAVEVREHGRDGTILPSPEGSWTRGPAVTFPLQRILSSRHEALKYLAFQWRRTMWLLGKLPSYQS